MESVPYIFSNDAMKKLLANKHVVFIGDSGKLRCSCHHGLMVFVVYKPLNGLTPRTTVLERCLRYLSTLEIKCL